MEYKYLDRVNSPDDIKALKRAEIKPLCEDIRSFLIESARTNGGHLASNLGTVELSVALHRVFNSPLDRIIFDVGHQAYTHKIITGRKNRFSDLRRPGGLSGFTLTKESEHDPFGAGHSSTALSAALGFAESNKLTSDPSYTVCVIGDGAYTGGMVHEAINNCNPDLKLIIVLNENGMSISPTKGAFASYLSCVRISGKYRKVKTGTTALLEHIPLLGKALKFLLGGIKNLVKKMIYKPNYFEQLGFYYIGAIDGNDEEKVEWALKRAKDIGKCVIVHVKTVKGKGSPEAEMSPESYHSVAHLRPESTFHSVFAKQLVELAQKDEKIVAITAAMGAGTGLNYFNEKYPERAFDVGIAEEHALTFSAGLASSGLKPCAAIYSTFLQRGYDNILHDIALQSLPVRLLIDRAGLAEGDGATHHGIFDVAFLSHIPSVELFAPASYSSLKATIDYAFGNITHPVAIRYPNAPEISGIDEKFAYKSERIAYRYDFDKDNPPKNILVTYGNLAERVLEAKESLNNAGIEVGVVLVEKIKPYNDVIDFLSSVISDNTRVVYAEEGIKNGGAAMITAELLRERGALFRAEFEICAIDDNFASPDTLCDLYGYVGLSSEKLKEKFTKK